MSKSKSTKKKAAQGKAKPKPVATRNKAVTSKKTALKPAPKKKRGAVPIKKPLPQEKSILSKKTAPAKKSVVKPTSKKLVKKESKTAPKKKAATPKPVVNKPLTKIPPAKAVTSKSSLSDKFASSSNATPQPQPLTKPAQSTAPAAKTAKTIVPSSKPVLVPAVIVAAPIKKTPVRPIPAPGPTKSGALFYDSHMHTPLCKHAWGEPEEYAQQALKAGLKGIIFTCHCPMPDGFWPTVRMSNSEFDTYVAIVERAANAFKGKLDIRLGIESEFFPGCEEWITKLHQRADFHYVLGAVHWQAKEYLNKFETGTIENFRRAYFENLAKSAESGFYDCLAHPDLVKNYHPDSWCFAIIKNTVSTVLDRIAATGVAMELNTSGLNKSYSEMNPGLEMLRMMADRKIPVVVGSDSHRPVRVGEQFVTALNHLTEVGYEKVSYFLNRQRIDLKISDVLASLKKAADHNA